MRYEWDERKNRENFTKHGVTFEDAALVFQDLNCLIYSDRVDSSGELRWHAIGEVLVEARRAAVLLVVHAYREDYHGEEIIRIISARMAEKHERRRYQEAAPD